MRTIALLLSLALFTLNGWSADAQAIVQSAATGSTAGLGARLALDLNSVTVEQAIRTIGKQAGLRVTISRDVLMLGRKVTIRSSGITAEDAFREVLKGTGVTMSTSQDGQVVFTQHRVVRDRKVQGVIAGRVTDAKTSKPISGASVSIGAVSDRGVTTGEDGSYRLTGVANGTHTVTVRIIGYAKQSRQVTVAEGTTMSADFRLEPSASVLDQVVVTGSITAVEKRSVPNTMTVLSGKDLEDRGIARIDQLFRGEVPGVFVQNTMASSAGISKFGNRGMSVRGQSQLNTSASFESSPIKTYVDGVEMADPSFLGMIDPKSIERIEIITGPQASTIYGSGAINGVMQIFTKKGVSSGSPHITLSLQSGTVKNILSDHLSPSHDHSVQLMGGGQATTYSLGGGYNSQGAWYPGFFTRTVSGYGSARHIEGPVTAEASARLSLRKLGTPLQGPGDVLAYESGRRATVNYFPAQTDNRVESRTLGLVVTANLFSWWQQRASLGTDESNTQVERYTPTYSFGVSDTLVNFSASNRSKLTAQYNTTLSRSFTDDMSTTFTAGLDYMGYDSNDWSGGGTVLVGSLNSFPGIQRSEEANTGYYAQGHIAFRDAFFLTSGVRIEENSNYGVSYGRNIAPRVGISAVREAGPVTTKLRTAYGVATKAPRPGQRESSYTTVLDYGTYERVRANPRLGPETQRGGEGGLEIYFGSRASVQVTHYNQIVEDVITSVVTGDSFPPLPGSIQTLWAPQFQNVNVGRIANHGWEGVGDIKLFGNLSLNGTISNNKSRVRKLAPDYRCTSAISGSTSQCLFPGSAFSGGVEHTAAMRLSYSDRKTNAHISLSHIGQTRRANFDRGVAIAARLRVKERYYIPPASLLVAPGYETIDLRVYRAINGHLGANLSVLNITNAMNSDTPNGSTDAVLGRQLNLGARFTW